MPRRLFAALVVLCLSACASARDPDFSKLGRQLKSHATETVDINLGPIRLGLASWFLGKSDDPDAVALRKTLRACSGVHIRHYEFASDFEYPTADIDAIQAQLSGHGWSSLVTVRDRKAKENVDVYLRLQGEKITGFVVLASEPREFTLINLVGSLDVAEIENLRTHFASTSHRHRHYGPTPDSAPPDETPPDL